MLVERPLWPLYAEGVLWARNVRQKPPWTLCALWEIKLPSVLFVCHLIEWVCSFSHRRTQKNRTHRVSERWWPLPRPLPRREGEWSPRYPYKKEIGFVLSLISIYDSFNVLWYLYAGGVLWVRNGAQKGSVKSVCSVREKPPHSESQAFFSHRFTQRNRTHSIPQRH